jgi:RHS repeat-associated protein
MKKLLLIVLLIPLQSGCWITMNIVGDGRVTSASGSFVCSNDLDADCSEQYNGPGIEVFTAEAEPGSVFTKWDYCFYQNIDTCAVFWYQESADHSGTLPIVATFKEKRPPVLEAEYTYNALGQRITRKLNGAVTLFQYDLAGNLISEIDASTGQPLREHVHVRSAPVAMLQTRGETVTPFFVHTDHLGTPTLVTNGGKNVVADIEATPFGEAFIEYSTMTHNRRFPGQYKDDESGLHYNYFRDYDPSLGRYLQSDPIGLRGGLNTYAYVDSNPLTHTDPYGLVKLYGNWCGPDWTGGFRKSYNQLDSAERYVALPPIDNLDTCCQSHDITYASCRDQYPCDKQKRANCMRSADSRLSSCAAVSGGGQSPMLLLFGNPRKRIENYMRDSVPNGGDNAKSCECITG